MENAGCQSQIYDTVTLGQIGILYHSWQAYGQSSLGQVMRQLREKSNKVYLMKKLFDMRMKEGTNVTTHLNDFNVIFTQLVSQGLDFGEEVKCIFMLCSLPPSWDTFCTAISNSAPAAGLVYNDVIGSLLTEEIRQKSMESTTHGAVHVTSSGKPRGRTQKRDKSKECTRSQSRNPKKDIE